MDRLAISFPKPREDRRREADVELLLQVGNSLLFGGVVRPCFLLEGRRPVLEELFLPAIEDRGLQAQFIAELLDRLLVQQMPPQDDDLLFRRVVLPLLLHAFSPCTLLGERLLHFQLNRNKPRGSSSKDYWPKRRVLWPPTPNQKGCLAGSGDPSVAESIRVLH